MTTIERLEKLILMNLGDLHRELFNKANKFMSEKGFPIQAEQIPVLMTCYCVGNTSQQEIADLCGRDKSSVQRTVTYLVKHGLVEIKQDANDKRKNIVQLTGEGTKLGKRIEDGVVRMEEKLFGGKISETDKQAFIESIKKIKKIVLEA
ncbi:MAG TPA: MarR family transcriptional regulator [Flavipsychrobacter sp.]|nr:MarR family transcriptional regulator [Flavipsychrobacter sp.]